MKLWMIPVVCLLTLPSMAAEITSPFYLPEAGHVWGKTEAVFIKDKIKDKKTVRFYDQGVGQKLSLGLGGGLAALVEGNMHWIRQKQEKTFSYPRTKEYAAGIKGGWNFDSFLTQLSVLYRQTTNVNFSARRLMETHLRLGKQLKTMTPYLHLAGRFPLNARPEVNAPIYRAETGVFQTVNDKMTLDSALFLNYNKNIKERSYGIRSEISYSLFDGVAVGINGEWQARGRAKNNAHTYHQKVGASIQFAF